MNEIHGRGEKTVTGRDAHRHRDLRSVPQQRIERFHLVCDGLPLCLDRCLGGLGAFDQLLVAGKKVPD